MSLPTKGREAVEKDRGSRRSGGRRGSRGGSRATPPRSQEPHQQQPDASKVDQPAARGEQQADTTHVGQPATDAELTVAEPSGANFVLDGADLGAIDGLPPPTQADMLALFKAQARYGLIKHLISGLIAVALVLAIEWGLSRAIGPAVTIGANFFAKVSVAVNVFLFVVMLLAVKKGQRAEDARKEMMERNLSLNARVTSAEAALNTSKKEAKRLTKVVDRLLEQLPGQRP